MIACVAVVPISVHPAVIPYIITTWSTNSRDIDSLMYLWVKIVIHTLGMKMIACVAVYSISAQPAVIQLRNEFNFWNVHRIKNTSCLLQSK